MYLWVQGWTSRVQHLQIWIYQCQVVQFLCRTELLCKLKRSMLISLEHLNPQPKCLSNTLWQPKFFTDQPRTSGPSWAPLPWDQRFQGLQRAFLAGHWPNLQDCQVAERHCWLQGCQVPFASDSSPCGTSTCGTRGSSCYGRTCRRTCSPPTEAWPVIRMFWFGVFLSISQVNRLFICT